MMRIPQRLYLVLTIFILAILGCSLGTPAPIGNPSDPNASNTHVALTAQAQLTQIAIANPPTQAAPPPPTLTDEAAIKAALLAKLGWTEPELEFSMSQNIGQYAQGSLKNINEPSGAAWFAAKDSIGQWQIAYIGNGLPDCSEIQSFQFPVGWLTCMDASGNAIDPSTGQPLAPAAPPMTDEAAIRAALLAKMGWSESELEFSISQNTGQYAQGSLKKVGEPSGAAWFAAKNSSGQWVIAYVGQGIPYCSEIQPYNLPPDWISHCADSNGNLIER